MRALRVCATQVSRGRFKIAPITATVIAPELALKVAACIVERHSGHGLPVVAGAGAVFEPTVSRDQ